MRLLDRLFGVKEKGLGVEELARRLGMEAQDLRQVKPEYRSFEIPKRSGGARRILAPSDSFKKLQRLLLRRVLGRLRSHSAVHGFERGRSIVSNARPHVGKEIVARLDVKDFFASTSTKRVNQYFRKIGWNADAADLLTRLCTHEGGLPQGAPTSPRLANLVNHGLDACLAAFAEKHDIAYTRYADDLTFSCDQGRHKALNELLHRTCTTSRTCGYEIHMGKKRRIRRRHHRQVVTGLVVNQKPNLPRATRRRLRAIEHHIATGRPATLTPAQLAGWRSFRAMIEEP